MNILFLEDEPTIREVLTEYMKMQGYSVTCAGDGEEALDDEKTQVQAFNSSDVCAVPGQEGDQVGVSIS